MKTPRYDSTGNWYKGNCHLHSTASDGGKTFPELSAMYAEAGYDFLFRTDHSVASDVSADTEEYPLLWLDGIELGGDDRGGSSYHAVCLGKAEAIPRELGFVAAMESARAQGGLLVLAHPMWMGNTQEDALRHGFHGVEIYNHVCQWLNGKGDALVYWHLMLERNPSTLGFAVDDAHIRPEHPGWNGGWIVVSAPELSAEAIMSSIRAGRFYSSCGPEFSSIEHEGRQVTIRTSPVQFARLVGPASGGQRVGSFEGELLTEVTFEVPADWPFAYIEVEDAVRRRAWTNTLFRMEPDQNG